MRTTRTNTVTRQAFGGELALARDTHWFTQDTHWFTPDTHWFTTLSTPDTHW